MQIDEKLIELIQSKRKNILENFSKHNKNEAIQQQFLQNHYQYQISGASDKIKQLEAMSYKAPYQFHLSEKQSLSYRQIKVQELELQQNHQGRYIELVLIQDSYRQMDSFNFLATNSEQQITGVDLNTLPSVQVQINDSEAVYDTSFYLTSQRLVVLDPFYHCGPDFFPVVEVDSTTNLIFLQPGESFSSIIEKEQQQITALELKNLGNSVFQSGQYQKAISLYTLGIQKLKCNTEQNNNEEEQKQQQQDLPLQVVLFGNRSQANYNLRNYKNSLEDAKKALEIDPKSDKNQMRKLQSLIMMDNEPETLNQIETLDKNNKEVKQAIKLFNLRQDQRKGIYDYFDLLNQFSSQKDPNLQYQIEANDYIGPVEIKIDGAKGRALFANEDVPPGTVLFSEKIFSRNALKLNKQEETQLSLIFQMKPENVSLFMDTYIQMLKSTKNRNKFLHLYNGSNADLPLSIENFKNDTWDEQNPIPYTFDDVVTTINKNKSYFLNIDQRFMNAVGSSSKTENNRGMVALYDIMNHCCNPNTRTLSIGNQHFVVACSKISKGEEITNQYVGFEYNYTQRRPRLQELYNFVCDCTYCVGEETYMDQKAHELLKQIHKTNSNKDNISEKNQKKIFQEQQQQYIKIQEIFKNYKYEIPEQTVLEFQLLEMFLCYGDDHSFFKAFHSYRQKANVMDLFMILKNVEQIRKPYVIKAVQEAWTECFKRQVGNNQQNLLIFLNNYQINQGQQQK